MTDIQKVGVRTVLDPRREPYWRHLEGTGYIGYRKMPSGVQTWQARWRGEDGKPLQRSLGKVSKDNDYDAACKSARDWFKQCEQGVPKAGTVEEACKVYVDNLAVKRPGAETDPELRFKKLIYKTPFGRKKLDKLRVIDVQRWRKDLIKDDKRTKATANRNLRSFKAAMNYALKCGSVATDTAWKNVEPYANAEDGRREIYLTKKQIAEMLAAAPADLAALLRGYLYTGCRPGELPQARVKDLNAKVGTLTLRTRKGRQGKIRERQVPLAGAALTFFKEQAKDKLPNAFLVTQADGEPWDKKAWSEAIQELRNAVESLPGNLVAYHLRHTTISRWLANRVNLETVAKVTGTSIGMIERTYFHFIPADVADQLAAIDIV